MICFVLVLVFFFFIGFREQEWFFPEKQQITGYHFEGFKSLGETYHKCFKIDPGDHDHSWLEGQV